MCSFRLFLIMWILKNSLSYFWWVCNVQAPTVQKYIRAVFLTRKDWSLWTPDLSHSQVESYSLNSCCCISRVCFKKKKKVILGQLRLLYWWDLKDGWLTLREKLNAFNWEHTFICKTHTLSPCGLHRGFVCWHLELSASDLAQDDPLNWVPSWNSIHMFSPAPSLLSPFL